MLKKDVVDFVLSLRTRRLMPVKAVLIFGTVAWVLSGCASWPEVGGAYRGSLFVGGFQWGERVDFQATLPTGWRRARPVQDALLLTRDGVSLQYMRIGVLAVGDVLPLTKKTFAHRMSPQEVAALELDEVQSDQTLRNFALVENTPVPVAGLPGFKLIYTFKAENGLRLKRVHYGVMARGWVYRVQYEAPVRYYFEKDLATFERVRESFRITERP